MEYDENNKPVRIDAVVISSQHAETVTNEELHADILKHVIQAVLPANGWTSTPNITSIRLAALLSADPWATPD